MSLRKFTLDMIDKYGLDQTIKIMGYRHNYLDFFKKTKIPIPSHMKQRVVVEFLYKNYTYKNPLKYKDFEIHSSNEVSVQWMESESRMTFYATPWWDCDSCIALEWDCDDFDSRPISEHSDCNDYIEQINNDKNEFDNIDELIEWFLNDYLKIVSDVLYNNWNVMTWK